jgi:signal transduction histidine kinase
MPDYARGFADRFRRSRLALPMAAVVAVAMVFISEGSYWRAKDSMDELGRLGTARTAIQNLHRNMVDAESGQRGFLITRRPEYLAPYRDASEEIRETMRVLNLHFKEQPAKNETMKRLDDLVQSKLSEMETTIGLADEGKDEQWREIFSTGIGREKMDQIRAVSSQLLADETNKVTIARAGIYDTLLLNRFGIGAMTLLSLLALYLVLRQTVALDRQREDHAHAVQAERDHLEREVRRRTAQLIELARHLQTAREDERHRLARELHDELGALLTAAKLDAARLRSRIAALAPEAVERLNHLSETLNSGIALKRRIIEDLRPSALSNLGLVAALDILTREFSERSGIAIDKQLDAVPLSPAAELTVYRLVQEALTNITKYAKAKHVTVQLGAQQGRVKVSVQDDGMGFDPSSTGASSHGLFGMRYRVEAEGGELLIESAPGAGTQIGATLPCSETPAVAADAIA